MCDPQIVAVKEAIEHGYHEAVGFTLTDRAQCLDLLIQFTSRHSLKDQTKIFFILEDLVELDDRGVVDLSHELDLVLKADKIIIGKLFFLHKLDGYCFSSFSIHGQSDCREGSLANFILDLVLLLHHSSSKF